jgi:ferredoxin
VGRSAPAGGLSKPRRDALNATVRRPAAAARAAPWSRQVLNMLSRMAYVIAEPCIGTKDNSCVEVCPVDCIHPTPDEPDYDRVEQLYIDPEECIDCDACVEACPVDACFAEDQLPEEWQRFSQINVEYFTTK